MIGNKQEKPTLLTTELVNSKTEIADLKTALETNSSDLQKLTEEVDKVKGAVQPK